MPTTCCSSGTTRVPVASPGLRSTTRPMSTTSWPRRSPRCSAPCSAGTDPRRASSDTSSARSVTRRSGRTAAGVTVRSATAHTSRPSIRSPGARTPTSSGWPSSRCRASRATCCGAPRWRADRTPTSPGRSAPRRRRSAPAPRGPGTRSAVPTSPVTSTWRSTSRRARGSAPRSGPSSSTSSAAARAAGGDGRWKRTSPSAPRCRDGRDRLERFNERLRTAPPLVPVAAAGSVSLLARLAPVLAGAVAATTLAVVAVVAPPRGEAGGRIVNDEPATTTPSTTQVVRDEPADTDHAAARDGGDRSAAARLGCGGRPDRRLRRSRPRPLARP